MACGGGDACCGCGTCTGTCYAGCSSGSSSAGGCDGCDGGCSGCGSGCSFTCSGCSGCTGCSSGCSGSCGGCDACTGCTGSCEGQCNHGCSTTSATNAYNYINGSNGTQAIIYAAIYNNIRSVVASSLSRHGKTNSVSNVTAGTIIDDAKWNELRTALASFGSSYDPGAVNQGRTITATQRNNMITKAKSAFNLVKGRP